MGKQCPGCLAKQRSAEPSTSVVGKNAHVKDGLLVQAIPCAVVVRHGENESGCLTAKAQQRPPTKLAAETPSRGRLQEATSSIRGTGSGYSGHIRGIRRRSEYSGHDTQ
jgi:hypothetical protein